MDLIKYLRAKRLVFKIQAVGTAITNLNSEILDTIHTYESTATGRLKTWQDYMKQREGAAFEKDDALRIMGHLPDYKHQGPVIQKTQARLASLQNKIKKLEARREIYSACLWALQARVPG